MRTHTIPTEPLTDLSDLDVEKLPGYLHDCLAYTAQSLMPRVGKKGEAHYEDGPYQL